MKKCWRGDKTRRPRVEEVVKEIDAAAANWHTAMEPSGPEQREDSFVEGELGVDNGVFALISDAVAFALRLYSQLDYLNGMRVEKRYIHTLVSIPRLNLLKNLESSPSSNT